MSRVGSMVAPPIITLVKCLLLQKYWRRVYQFCVTGRIYVSSSEYYPSNMIIISEILKEVLSVLCHGQDLW